MKNAVFWNDMYWDSCKNLGFRGTYRLHHEGVKKRRAKQNVFLLSVSRLLFPANVVPSPPILVTRMMDALLSSETSVLTTQGASQETTFIISHRRENLRSYIVLTGWDL
jgi:hypothetical protein